MFKQLAVSKIFFSFCLIASPVRKMNPMQSPVAFPLDTDKWPKLHGNYGWNIQNTICLLAEKVEKDGKWDFIREGPPVCDEWAYWSHPYMTELKSVCENKAGSDAFFWLHKLASEGWAPFESMKARQREDYRQWMEEAEKEEIEEYKQKRKDREESFQQKNAWLAKYGKFEARGCLVIVIYWGGCKKASNCPRTLNPKEGNCECGEYYAGKMVRVGNHHTDVFRMAVIEVQCLGRDSRISNFPTFFKALKLAEKDGNAKETAVKFGDIANTIVATRPSADYTVVIDEYSDIFGM